MALFYLQVLGRHQRAKLGPTVGYDGSVFAQISTEIAPGASGLTWHFGAETDLLNIQCSMNILSDLFVSTLLQ